jgi:hypothetical protein
MKQSASQENDKETANESIVDEINTSKVKSSSPN